MDTIKHTETLEGVSVFVLPAASLCGGRPLPTSAPFVAYAGMPHFALILSTQDGALIGGETPQEVQASLGALGFANVQA